MKRLTMLSALMVMALLRMEAADITLSAKVENQAVFIPGEARKVAMAMAGVLTKEGFRIRDGEWSASLNRGLPVFLKITLFAGEEYGFVAVTTSSQGNPLITLFDAAGKVVKTKSCATGQPSSTAVRIAPVKSGAYFVRLELPDGPATAVDASLIYLYK